MKDNRIKILEDQIKKLAFKFGEVKNVYRKNLEELQIRIEDGEKMYGILCNQKEQIEEANNIILTTAFTTDDQLQKAIAYVKKWKVKKDDNNKGPC